MKQNVPLIMQESIITPKPAICSVRLIFQTIAGQEGFLEQIMTMHMNIRYLFIRMITKKPYML